MDDLVILICKIYSGINLYLGCKLCTKHIIRKDYKDYFKPGKLGSMYVSDKDKMRELRWSLRINSVDLKTINFKELTSIAHKILYWSCKDFRKFKYFYHLYNVNLDTNLIIYSSDEVLEFLLKMEEVSTSDLFQRWCFLGEDPDVFIQAYNPDLLSGLKGAIEGNHVNIFEKLWSKHISVDLKKLMTNLTISPEFELYLSKKFEF